MGISLKKKKNQKTNKLKRKTEQPRATTNKKTDFGEESDNYGDKRKN